MSDTELSLTTAVVGPKQGNIKPSMLAGVKLGLHGAPWGSDEGASWSVRGTWNIEDHMHML